MKSRKSPSYNEAIEYMKSKGKLTFKGKGMGSEDIYTLDIVGHPRYILNVRKDGRVQIIYETNFKG